MKPTRILLPIVLLCLTFLQAFAQKTSTYTLTEAINKKLVKADIRGVDTLQTNSSHNTGKCMQITVTNITPRPFTVQIEAGQQLEPLDSSVQTMLVTEGATFNLAAKSTIKKYINALCMQMNDKAPVNENVFGTGKMSTDNLQRFAKITENKKYFDSTAQYALWCLTDNISITYIKNKDSMQVAALQKFVSEATGQPIPKYKNGKLVVSMTETLEWGADKNHVVTLSIINAKTNKVVKNILKDSTLGAGHHVYNTEISNVHFDYGTYKVVLYLNGKLQMTRPVKLEKSEFE